MFYFISLYITLMLMTMLKENFCCHSNFSLLLHLCVKFKTFHVYGVHLQSLITHSFHRTIDACWGVVGVRRKRKILPSKPLINIIAGVCFISFEAYRRQTRIYNNSAWWSVCLLVFKGKDVFIFYFLLFRKIYILLFIWHNPFSLNISNFSTFITKRTGSDI